MLSVGTAWIISFGMLGAAASESKLVRNPYFVILQWSCFGTSGL